MFPVIYTMEPIGVNESEEATGVLFFCSLECRDTAMTERRVESDGPIALGMSGDHIDNTCCDECGFKLEISPNSDSTQ